MKKNIDLYAVGDLLDGRHFFIPAYQRGYRWCELQMEELLEDLFEFALRKKKDREFYCLQPIIVQRIVDERKLQEITMVSGWNDVTDENTWEVVDGQQRLTSIYIIFRYLMEEGVVNVQKMAQSKRKLYSLCYETHPETKDFLEVLSKESVDNIDNIDKKHIAEAFKCVREWFNTKAAKIARRLKLSDEIQEMQETLRNLLNCKKEEVAKQTGSAQFIWYELQPDSKVNPINEFLNINNGKIPLTDAELIKALFLQKKNFTDEAVKGGRQTELALEWETIENSLHRNDFWQFICATGEDSDNRIELLLRLRYQQKYDGKEPENGELFRYFYNNIWNGKSGMELQNTVMEEWGKLRDLYNTIESWYEDPVRYNYIGFLIHAGFTLFKIISLYDTIDRNTESNVFMEEMKKEIAKKLPSERDVEDSVLSLSYNSNKNNIRDLLLFLNIYQLNAQIEALRKNVDDQLMAPIYKFPFDLYVSQKWNIEHIDSATENDLSKLKDQKAWAEQSLPFLGKEEQKEIRSLLEEGKNSEAIRKVLQISRDYDEATDDGEKNGIGNLTLLDEETNKSYKNDIFALKRDKIVKAIKGGKFVPLCTQLVFNKNFDNSDTDFRKWKKEDKQGYQKYIIEQLGEFYKSMRNDGEQL